jgi:hypothetical protein
MSAQASSPRHCNASPPIPPLWLDLLPSTSRLALVPRNLSSLDYRLQQLGGILLFYCLAIDSTGLPAVNTIESALSHATQLTQRAADRLLAYFRNYPDNISVLIKANPMLLTVSALGGIAYLGNADPTAINGPIMVFSYSKCHGIYR